MPEATTREILASDAKRGMIRYEARHGRRTISQASTRTTFSEPKTTYTALQYTDGTASVHVEGTNPTILIVDYQEGAS